jgi:hypothetical protein
MTERCPHTGFFPLIVHPMEEWAFIEARLVKDCCYIISSVEEA